MVEKEKKDNIICSANDLERTYGSRKRLLLLSHAFHEKEFNRKKKSVIEYPNIPFAIHPVPHSDELPIPEPSEIDLLSSDDAESSEECNVSEPCTSRNKGFGITTEPHLINEGELNDFVRDLDLPKVKAELLAFR